MTGSIAQVTPAGRYHSDGPRWQENIRHHKETDEGPQRHRVLLPVKFDYLPVQGLQPHCHSLAQPHKSLASRWSTARSDPSEINPGGGRGGTAAVGNAAFPGDVSTANLPIDDRDSIGVCVSSLRK
jgi:hypothetical protein